MLAITISCSHHDLRGRVAPPGSQSRSVVYTLARVLLLGALLFPIPWANSAQSPPSLQHAREVYKAAQQRFHSAQTNPAAAWEFGRAAFDLADLSQNDGDRHRFATAGMDACRTSVSLKPNSAAGHYYLALNLGQFARAKRIGALKGLREMEQSLLRAAQLEPTFDYAGPDRSLGLLYLEAPAWPVSLGNRHKARAHLQAAVKLSPDYPGNRIALAEAYSRWHEFRNLRSELDLFKESLPQFEARFPRETWAADWSSWEARLKKLHKTVDDRAQ